MSSWGRRLVQWMQRKPGSLLLGRCLSASMMLFTELMQWSQLGFWLLTDGAHGRTTRASLALRNDCCLEPQMKPKLMAYIWNNGELMEPDPVPCQGPLEVPGERLGGAFTPRTGSMSPKSLLSLRRLYECMEVLTHWLTRREGRHRECGELEQGAAAVDHGVWAQSPWCLPL